MRVDFTPVYLAFGIGLASYFILRLRRVKPPVKFRDVIYDKNGDEVRLVVENVTDKPVYVKPALRVVRLTPVHEWREKTSNGTGIPMMAASAGSVIKGYELLGEYAEPVLVEPNSTTTVTYPLMRDFGLRAYDNIKVDSVFGSTPEDLSGNTTTTVRMNLSELLNGEQEQDTRGLLHEDQAQLQELVETLEELIHEAALEYPQEGSFSEIVRVESKDGQSPPDPECRRNEFPIESMCFCCGKQRWLNWVVDGDHVCDECKEYLIPPQSESDESVDPVFGDVEDDYEEYPQVEVICHEPVELKPRHEKILEVLNAENTVSVKEMAKRLNLKEKNISTDLRYLMNHGLVDRVKIGRVYKYFSLKDGEQVILQQGGESVDTLHWT
jgi:DNA-binding transcriptional ArsR family regulator